MPRQTKFATATENTRALARQNYESFVRAGAKNPDGTALKSWAELPDDQKDHWIAVAESSLTNDQMLYNRELSRQNEAREQERRTGTSPSGDPYTDALRSQNIARATATAPNQPAPADQEPSDDDDDTRAKPRPRRPRAEGRGDDGRDDGTGEPSTGQPDPKANTGTSQPVNRRG